MKFASYYKKAYDDSYVDYSYFKMARFDIPDFVTPTKRYYDTYLFVPNKPCQPESWLSFKQWWKGKLITFDYAPEQFLFTRQNIVMTEANQDGGAHFDSKLQPYYEWLRDGATGPSIEVSSSLVYQRILGGNIASSKPDDFAVKPRDINLAMTRQIVHELLLSIMQLKHLTFHVTYEPDLLHNFNNRLNYISLQPGLRTN